MSVDQCTKPNPRIKTSCSFCKKEFLALRSEVVRGGGKFCTKQCGNRGSVKPLLQRFWERVDKNGPIPSHCPELGPCWVWTAGKHSFGYGVISQGKGKTPHCTHRLSWQIHVGEIPGKFHVLHKCDNPSCVNPEHLWLGTATDNMKDMVAKGRQAKTGAKLTWEKVRRLRARYAEGGMSLAELAIELAISKQTVRDIVRGVTWKE